MHVALANLFCENTMVRDGFFYHCKHFFTCLCLGLVLSFTVFIVLTVSVSASVTRLKSSAARAVYAACCVRVVIWWNLRQMPLASSPLPARQLCCKQVLFLASVCASVRTKSRKVLIRNRCRPKLVGICLYARRWMLDMIGSWRHLTFRAIFTTSAASSDYWWRSGVKEGTLTQLL